MNGLNHVDALFLVAVFTGSLGYLMIAMRRTDFASSPFPWIPEIKILAVLLAIVITAIAMLFVWVLGTAGYLVSCVILPPIIHKVWRIVVGFNEFGMTHVRRKFVVMYLPPYNNMIGTHFYSPLHMQVSVVVSGRVLAFFKKTVTYRHAWAEIYGGDGPDEFRRFLTEEVGLVEGYVERIGEAATPVFQQECFEFWGGMMPSNKLLGNF